MSAAMTYEDIEAEGRMRLLDVALGHTAAARGDMPPETAARHRTRADECRKDAESSVRYLWRITVGGGYGTIHVIGTPAYAEGRRSLKAKGEGATGRAEKVREALPSEANGDTEVSQ